MVAVVGDKKRHGRLSTVELGERMQSGLRILIAVVAVSGYTWVACRTFRTEGSEYVTVERGASGVTSSFNSCADTNTRTKRLNAVWTEHTYRWVEGINRRDKKRGLLTRGAA